MIDKSKDEAGGSMARSLGTLAKNPLLGVTAPVGAIGLWLVTLTTGIEGELADLAESQRGLRESVIETKARVDLMAERVASRSAKIDELSVTVPQVAHELTTLAHQVSKLDERITDLERSGRR